MCILQVFYPLSVVITPVGMLVMLVMMHFNAYHDTCINDWRLRTADCGPGVKCSLSVKWRLQSESKTQAGCKMQNKDCRLGVKYRPNIYCSRDGLKGKINPASTCKRSLTIYLLLMCFHKSISFFSGKSLMTRKLNCSLELFFLSQRPHASTLEMKFSIHVTMNNTHYNTRVFMLKWLLTQNTEKKE